MAGRRVPSFVVWLYGDGEAARMYSELVPLLPSSISVLKKTPMESTGPDWLPGFPPPLVDRICLDLTSTPVSSWPDLVHIGYSASALSYTGCGSPNWAEQLFATVTSEGTVASEAGAIRDAADFVRSVGIQVLLSKGPGAAAPAVCTVKGTPQVNECMDIAFKAVGDLLDVIAHEYPYVDFSGYTAGVAGGTVVPEFQLVPAEPEHWETDCIHISCDIARYSYAEGQPYTGCVTVSDETARKQLGAWRVANTVLKAYEYFEQKAHRQIP